MKVVAIETGFYGGKRLYPGDKFEFTGEKCGKWFVPVDKKAPATEDAVTGDGPTRKELMVQLEQAGVPFKQTMNKAELLGLLKSTIESYAPGSSTADNDIKERIDEVA